MLISTITDRDPLLENKIYRDFHRVGQLLVERRLEDKEIQDLFKAVEKGYSDSGQNRTMIGKGKDVATDVGSAIANAYRGVADKISKSAVVSTFDVEMDKLTDKIKSAAGGDGRIMQAIYKYRDFAKRNPKMQGAILAGMLALAGITGAGLGGAALIMGIRTFDSMLKGNKASSALWQGFLAGTLAYGAGQIGQALSAGPGVTGQGGPDYEPDVTGQGGPDYEPVARPETPARPPGGGTGGGGTGGGGTGGGLTSNFVDPDTGPGPDTTPTRPPVKDVNLPSAPERPLPPNLRGEVGTGTGGTVTSSSGQPVMTTNYAGLDQATYNRALQDLSPEQLARLGNADPTDPFIRSRLGLPALREHKQIKPIPLRHLVDKDHTLWHWRLDESLDRRRGGLQFNRRGVHHVFRLIEQELTELDVKGARAQDVMARRGKASQRPTATIAKSAAGAPPAAAQPGQRVEPTLNPVAAASSKPEPQAASEPPEYLRPTRPGAPVQQPEKPGLMSRIGQGLQTFGRQLTTKVTAEKLNTNWKVAGSPTDSDKLFAFLIQQGVPDAVARQVYGDLKLQPPAAAAGTDKTPSDGGNPFQQPAPIRTKDPITGKQIEPAYTPSEVPPQYADYQSRRARAMANYAPAAPATAGDAGAAASSTASGSSQSAKMTADDIVDQIKPIWDKITANQDNPIGAPAVKQLLKTMWMQTGGTRADESRRKNKKKVDENIRWAIDHVRRRQKMLGGQRPS